MIDNISTVQHFNSSTGSPDVVIRVENLWKQYRYGTISHATLHKDLQSWWARVRGKEDPNSRIDSNISPSTFNVSQGDDRFWALKDINFEVKQGEVLGIIGRNGAGKSTLLKIMSKVTTPTKGQIKIRGRVASLLEVGTGFHPELTGRENIFLNGAILGMTKNDIKRQFDEIVSFAEIEKFVDTPVKRYSSGMYVRLAFAVAAHLEPEILIVDEVLAVGDAEFQKKCLGKLGEVAKEGRTVLFVSHNMGAVKSLCGRVILLDKGEVVLEGPPGRAVDHYLGDPGLKVYSYSSPEGINGPHFRAIELIQEERKTGLFTLDRAIKIVFRLETCGQKELDITVFVRNAQGVCVHHSSDSFYGHPDAPERTCEIPAHTLAAGRYHVDVYLSRKNYEILEYIDGALIFEADFPGLPIGAMITRSWQGVCGPGLIKWK